MVATVIDDYANNNNDMSFECFESLCAILIYYLQIIMIVHRLTKHSQTTETAIKQIIRTK